MKITNMEQVKENIGKKVLFQHYTMKKPVEATIVFGEYEDCEGDIMGWNKPSIRYDEVNDGYTWCSIDENMFENEDVLVLETIDE